MKRITIYIAHLLVLVLTGCDKTVLEFPENEGVDPTLVNANLSLAIDPKIEPYEQTGRSEGEVIDAYDVRWIVEVFRDEIGGELAGRRAGLLAPVVRGVREARLRAGGGRTPHDPHLAGATRCPLPRRSVDGLRG